MSELAAKVPSWSCFCCHSHPLWRHGVQCPFCNQWYGMWCCRIWLDDADYNAAEFCIKCLIGRLGRVLPSSVALNIYSFVSWNAHPKYGVVGKSHFWREFIRSQSLAEVPTQKAPEKSKKQRMKRTFLSF